MKMVFLSNYMNHHQKPLSDALYRLTDGNYCFIQTEPIEQERLEMGWAEQSETLPYLCKYYEDEKNCDRMIFDCDVLLLGWTGREELAAERLAAGKLTLRVSERLYKEGRWRAFSPRGLAAKYKEHTRYRKAPVYLLCAGAYTAWDFSFFHAYPKKMFRWGYFPEARTYTEEELFAKKPEGTFHIAWTGRFIPEKHPEYMIPLACHLRAAGLPFQIHMVGGGALEEKILQQAAAENLSDYITFHGVQSPEGVRDILEGCHIHLCTSTAWEGWGAVVNEGMNSGCVEIANVEVGAAPYLIRQGVNGFVYAGDSYGSLRDLVMEVCTHWENYRHIGHAAYETIVREWNADVAAQRLVDFSENLLAGNVQPYEEGILSPAPAESPRRTYRRLCKETKKFRSRIYVCHTLYHVYVTLLKEMNMPVGSPRADIALSNVFMDFEDLPERLVTSGVFENVLPLEEHYAEDFPEIVKYKQNYHNILRHTWNRILFTKKLGKAQEQYIEIPFESYRNIYVYCDSDPIGYYLSRKHIYYHAVEDGLDCLQKFDAAHADNAGHFALKAALAKRNLIFMQNGYGKYCLDMEINNGDGFDYHFDKYKVVPRRLLTEALTEEQKETILRIFLPDADEIAGELSGKQDCVLFLTEGFPGDRPDVRKAVADQILREYCAGQQVVIKPHPRDDLDYRALYPDCVVIRGKFPIEVLNFIPGIHFKKAVSIITSALDALDFVTEKVNVGPYIYDAYEPAEVHAFLKEAWDRDHERRK